ncbi:DUF4423 domain-containing protein [Bdellovibrio svalbardensis]|uniref:DUF4423 domain-containing protein n=1 Tax=Bdellovibrio svalbardensis TaxID=2972972 RepID=A0ABT6DJL8_9BACT|nr:DUF4423 domain-containing protein [Bdellovibrio svalbardensis]MDG0816046.1 DUF4423 domain-containing protein [Bdellovibrio svalbardensis]
MVLSGKAEVGLRLKKKLLQADAFSEEEQVLLEKVFKQNSKPLVDFCTIRNQDWPILSSWQLHAAVSVLQAADARFEVNWVARRLGLDAAIVEEIFEVLLRNEIVVQQEEDFDVKITHIGDCRTIFEMDFVKSYCQLNRKLIDEMPTTDEGDYGFNSMIFSIALEKMEEVKKLTQQFLNRIEQLSQKNTSGEVFNLTVLRHTLSRKL